MGKVAVNERFWSRSACELDSITDRCSPAVFPDPGVCPGSRA